MYGEFYRQQVSPVGFAGSTASIASVAVRRALTTAQGAVVGVNV